VPLRLRQALPFAIAAALLIAGAMSSRWLVVEASGLGAQVSLRIGLTSLELCASSLAQAQCQSIEWSQVGGAVDGSTWMWVGRLTFAVCIAAALGLVALGGLLAADIEVRLPVSLERVVMWLCLVILPLIAIYYLFPPAGLRELEAGRGFALGALGAVVGAFVTWNRLDRND
jgi:hypothetical protein